MKRIIIYLVFLFPAINGNVMAQEMIIPDLYLELERSGSRWVSLLEVSTSDAGAIRNYGKAKDIMVRYGFQGRGFGGTSDDWSAEARFTLLPNGRYEISESRRLEAAVGRLSDGSLHQEAIFNCPDNPRKFEPAGYSDDWKNYAVRAMNILRWKIREQDNDEAALLIDRWNFDNKEDKWYDSPGVMIFGSMGIDDSNEWFWDVEPGSPKWLDRDYVFISWTKPDPDADAINDFELPVVPQGGHIPDSYGLNLNPDGTCEYTHKFSRPRPNGGYHSATYKAIGRWEAADGLLSLYFHTADSPAIVPVFSDTTVDEEPNCRIILGYAIDGRKLTLTTRGYERMTAVPADTSEINHKR